MSEDTKVMEGDNEYDEEGTTHDYKPSFVLIAIDTHESMFVKDETGSSPFLDCIITCYDLADSLVLTDNRRNVNHFAIALANEDERATLVDFDNNFFDTVKLLKEQKQLSSENLKDLYVQKSSFDLSEFFLLCKKKFKDIKSEFFKRSLLYITNNDDPVKSDAAKKFALINQVKSFEPSTITFQVVTMKPDFNYEILYDELYSAANIKAEYIYCEDQEGLYDKISSSVVQKYSRRRMHFYPINGDGTRYLKICINNYVKSNKLLNNAHVNVDGQEVSKVMGNIIHPNEYKLQTINCETSFTPEERTALVQNDIPIGLTLLYVSDRIMDTGFIARRPVLMELDPTEDPIFFNTFWQYCAKKNKILVCLFKVSCSDKMRFVEVIPKCINDTKMFLIKQFPFNDGIKYPPKIVLPEFRYSDQMKKLMNNLVENLSFDYHPSQLKNPVESRLRAYVKAKLLNEKEEEEDADSVEINLNDKQVEFLAEEFNSLFSVSQGKKRKATGTTAAKRKK